MRTVHTVIDRSPAQFLKEVLLVDDFSDKGKNKFLRKNFDLLTFDYIVIKGNETTLRNRDLESHSSTFCLNYFISSDWRKIEGC